VHEIRQLFLDCIAQARRSIYIENQYFTSTVIADAITRRLREPDGPEIVVVSRLRGSGWLEENTMFVLRARLIRRLCGTAGAERLRLYCPHQAGLGDECIALHSKLMIVDDRVLRMGSANISNRSLGVDTECDLLIEAESDAERRAIAAARDSLLAEHLGVKRQDVAKAIEGQGSLIGGIESLRGRSRTLEATPPDVDPDLDALVPDAATIDPERPLDPDHLIDGIVTTEERPRVGKRIIVITLALLFFAALAAAWRWSPLGEWITPATFEALAETIRQAPATPVWVMLVYVVASLLAVPITLVVVATALAFGPWAGAAYALGGAVLGAAVTFALGRLLGRATVRRLAGSRLNALSRRLGRGGITAVFIFRILPVAPFTIVNLVAGASHLSLRDFLLGTALGMAPGIVAISVFTDRLAATLSDPSPLQITVLAVVLLSIALGAAGIQRWLTRRERGAGAA